MKSETKVGILVLLATGLVVFFAYLLGAFNPFTNTNELYVAYNFAGGVEVGSPVRVMGIKVGKVKRIVFDPTLKTQEGEEVKLKILITVSKEAWPTVRKDSRFFINLAGIIGEKFVEITPGSTDQPLLEAGTLVRGEDPPRIDQLISQSYGVAGQILKFIEKNEGSLSHTIELFDNLITNLNKTLVLLDKTTKKVEITALLKNLVQISGDIAAVSGRLRSEDTKKTLDLLHRLMWRLDDLDEPAIRKFLQDEGIRARIF